MIWCKNIVFFLAGLLAGILIFKIPKLQFIYEFKVLDLVGLVVTLIIAFIIQLYLVKKGDVDKTEKNIVIDQAKAVRERFDNVRTAAFEAYISQQPLEIHHKRLLSLFRILANSLEVFEHSASLANINCISSSKNRLRMIYFKYKALLTDGDFRKPISDNAFQLAEVAVNDAQRELVAIILKTNHA